MKNKIVIFKFLAAIIAVGGAFASVSANSSLVATSAYVRYTTSTHALYCTLVGTCDNPGPQACTAQVKIGSSGATINTPARVTVPPMNNTCPTAIAGTNPSSSVINPVVKVLPVDARIQ